MVGYIILFWKKPSQHSLYGQHRFPIVLADFAIEIAEEADLLFTICKGNGSEIRGSISKQLGFEYQADLSSFSVHGIRELR
ncbi:MAG: hypothetical protein ABIQ57_04375 [Candidatus Kapaibacterium sp.]